MDGSSPRQTLTARLLLQADFHEHRRQHEATVIDDGPVSHGETAGDSMGKARGTQYATNSTNIHHMCIVLYSAHNISWLY